MTAALTLTNRALTCTIDPERGAAVTRLDVVRRDINYHILHPTAEGASDPRTFSLVHLAPVCGPVRGNTFRWEGKQRPLEPNLPDAPFFTNGLAWQRPWEGKQHAKNTATLKYMHKKMPGWMFDFSIIATFDLEEDHLCITYEVANEGKQGMCPMGFGTSMRLPKGRKTLISAGVSSLWQMDENSVPTLQTEVPFDLDLKEGLVLDGLDNPERYFSGWTGKASIDYAESKLSTMVKGDSALPFLGFGCRKQDDFFRLSAMSHVPGVLDIKGYDEDETGACILSPGDSLTAQIKVDVDLSLY